MWVGNALDWVHPEGLRFDAVRIGLVAVPQPDRRALVMHHLIRTVATGGRLIVADYVATGASVENRIVNVKVRFNMRPHFDRWH